MSSASPFHQHGRAEPSKGLSKTGLVVDRCESLNGQYVSLRKVGIHCGKIQKEEHAIS